MIDRWAWPLVLLLHHNNWLRPAAVSGSCDLFMLVCPHPRLWCPRPLGPEQPFIGERRGFGRPELQRPEPPSSALDHEDPGGRFRMAAPTAEAEVAALFPAPPQLFSLLSPAFPLKAFPCSALTGLNSLSCPRKRTKTVDLCPRFIAVLMFLTGAERTVKPIRLRCQDEAEMRR